MKLYCDIFTDPVDIRIDRVNTLVIENPKLFLEVVSSFKGYGDMELLLSENDRILNLLKSIEVIDIFTPFDMNTKLLIGRVSTRMESIALGGEFFLRTQELLQNIELLFDDISFPFPCRISLSKLSAASLIKSIAPIIENDFDSLGEQLLTYFELIREFDQDRLFVLVNLRAYMDDDELEQFAKSLILSQFNVLLIDSASKERLSIENRRTVDYDLCEF